MFTRDFPLKVKALSDEGAFTGIASPYGDPPDLVGDVIEPGAFRQAIAQQGKGYPILWSHRQDEPIGIGRVEDSKDALLVHGQLLMDDPNAARAFLHMKAGTVKGLSIGYTIPCGQGKAMYRDDGSRILKEVHLHEISVVSVPAAPRAQITAVKALGDVRTLLRGIRDVDSDALTELQEIDRELKRLLVTHPQPLDAGDLAELKKFASELQRYAV